jgi:hypothetical protein
LQKFSSFRFNSTHSSITDYFYYLGRFYLNFEKPFLLYISGGVNVEVPALTLSDPLQSSTGAAQKHGRAGLNLLAAAFTAAWLIQ